MSESFYSTIAGAFVSLLGVLIVLRANQQNFEGNIREERRKAKEEREFHAKHGALLVASESVIRFIAYYVSLPDRDLSQNGIESEEITNLGVALNALHFYCGIETITQSTRLLNVLNNVVSEALKSKMPSLFVGEELKSIDIQISDLEKMNTGIQQEILSLLQSGNNNALLVTQREQAAKNYNTIAELHGSKVELIKSKYVLTENCRDVIMKNIRYVHESCRDVLLLSRRELSFPIDEDEYTKIMDASIDTSVNNFDDLIAEIRKQVMEKIA
jgi:hypothetical protein